MTACYFLFLSCYLVSNVFNFPLRILNPAVLICSVPTSLFFLPAHDRDSDFKQDSGGIWHLWWSLSTVTHHFFITNTATARVWISFFCIAYLKFHTVFQDCCHSGLLSFFISSHDCHLVFYQDLSDVACLLAIPVNVSAHHCSSSPYCSHGTYSPISLPLSFFPTSSCHTHLDAHWTSILVDLPLYTIYHDFKVLQRWLHYKSILNFISFLLNFMLLISIYLPGCYLSFDLP